MAQIARRKVFQNLDFSYPLDVDLPLQALVEYINDTKDFAERTKRKFYENEALKIEELKMDQYSYYDIVDHQISRFKKEHYFNSIFITSYSFFERKLRLFCEVAGKDSLVHFQRKGIDFFYNYLQKELKIDLNFLEKEWNLLKIYRELRNVLVHTSEGILESGRIKEGSDLRLLSSISFLKLNNYELSSEKDIGFQIEDEKFLLDFLELVSTFLRGIYVEN